VIDAATDGSAKPWLEIISPEELDRKNTDPFSIQTILVK
jgi:hypothetical protein